MINNSLREGLPNLKRKLQSGKSAVVAFLGGSITEGANASCPDTGSWRALIASRLSSAFPDHRIDYVNAGVGGTDSTFGAFRFREHAAAQGSIDLLFVEFAVNDCKNRTEAIQGMEGIVRLCGRYYPACDICFLYSPDRRCLLHPEVASWHEEVAAHYNLPSVHITDFIAGEISAGRLQWDQYASDDVHPTDYGHGIYAKLLWEFIECALEETLPHGQRTVPNDSVQPLIYPNARLVPLSAAESLQGFVHTRNYRPEPLWNWRYNKEVLHSVKPGDQLLLSFTGNAVGCLLLAGKDIGLLEYALEDGIWQVVDPYDTWCEQCWRPKPLILYNRLTPGQHTLAIRHGISERTGLGENGETSISILKFLIS